MQGTSRHGVVEGEGVLASLGEGKLSRIFSRSHVKLCDGGLVDVDLSKSRFSTRYCTHVAASIAGYGQHQSKLSQGRLHWPKLCVCLPHMLFGSPRNRKCYSSID